MGFGAGSKTNKMVGVPAIVVPPIPPTPLDVLNHIPAKIETYDFAIIQLKRTQLGLLRQRLELVRKKIPIVSGDVVKVDTPANRALYENLSQRIDTWKAVLGALEEEDRVLTEQVTALEVDLGMEPEQVPEQP